MDSVDLALVLPDGTELAYGPVPCSIAPAVGERITFQRSDREGKLTPDEHNLEEPRHWVVLGREWVIRQKPWPHVPIAFLVLRLGYEGSGSG
jgi:hypothetical protein